MRYFIPLTALIAPVLSLVPFEQVDSIPHGWSAAGNVNPDTELVLHAALQYQNLNKLEPALKSASTPCGSGYGQYQSLQEQQAMFAPSKQSQSKVKRWLEESGATNVQMNGHTITFRSTVAKANAMMNSDFKAYKRDGEMRIRTTAYSIPEELVGHIDLITPTTYFDTSKTNRVTPRDLDFSDLELEEVAAPIEARNNLKPSCLTTYISKRTGKHYEALTPKCLQQLYNTVGYTPDPNSGSNIAFANFLNETPSYSDLALFEKEFKIPSHNFTVSALINGGVNDQDPATEIDGEANLDVQNIAGLTKGLPISTYITGGSPPFVPDLLSPNASSNTNEPYLEYFNYLLAQEDANIPYVLSQSYGDHENTVPNKYATRVCNQIGMLGLRGRSVLFSSGDEGTGAVCRNNRPRGNLKGAPQFTVQFPSTCPYVTAVGGTQAYNPEVAWNASSGGFSNYFPQAFYQQDAINTYLNQYITPATKAYYSNNKYANLKGRGVPDVSAHSLYPYFLVYTNGSRSLSGGTSAAAPVFSSIVALLNDARFRAGKPALGFLNPWLYSTYQSTLTDVTMGAAVGCAGVDLQTGQTIPGAGIIPYASWNATVGWDPVTGLGLPDFEKMKASVLGECPSGYGYGK